MEPDALVDFAFAVIVHEREGEADLRRAISSAYYGLFHSLTTAGARRFLDAGPVLAAQVTRAYNHGTMRKVCEAYLRFRPEQPSPLLGKLVVDTPDERLLGVAAAFIDLQDARQAADYDLNRTVTWDEASEAMFAAARACADLRMIETQSETAVFLTALLIADRWSRRG